MHEALECTRSAVFIGYWAAMGHMRNGGTDRGLCMRDDGMRNRNAVTGLGFGSVDPDHHPDQDLGRTYSYTSMSGVKMVKYGEIGEWGERPLFKG